MTEVPGGLMKKLQKEGGGGGGMGGLGGMGPFGD